jgi:hypothetical protein
MYIYIYIYICIHMYMYIYIYVYKSSGWDPVFQPQGFDVTYDESP